MFIIYIFLTSYIIFKLDLHASSQCASSLSIKLAILEKRANNNYSN